MDFDPRWSDDPRDRDDYGRELSQGSRGGLSNPREREPLDARDVFTRDLELPRGPERERVWARDSDVRLRGSEVRTLATVGAFRVVPAGDLRDGQDRPLDPHRGDLRHLRDSGLVETIPAIGNDRALVVLTERGRDVLERNRWSNVQREDTAIGRPWSGSSTTGAMLTTSAADRRSRRPGRSSTPASEARATPVSPCTGRAS